MQPERLIAPGNDYRSLRSRIEGPVPSVAVIIPVYNRGRLLANVLAGLTRQTFDTPFEVVVADDGSTEDIGNVVDRYSDVLDLHLVSREHHGFGLARVRNLGLAATSADVVAFLDADCIPGDEWLSGHIGWHRRASNLIVTGPRRHVDALLSPDAIASGKVDVHDVAAPIEGEHDRYETDDWRRLVYRRSRRLILGDAGFRAAIGGNSSMHREMIEEVGGASREFRAWGGEDTELAWRLWNAGAFVVPEDRAIIYHQSYGEPGHAGEQRQAARRRVLPLVADRVPHRFYRKEPSHLYTVPKVSWLVTVADADEADRAWGEASKASYRDTELVLIGDRAAVETRIAAADAAPKLAVASTFAEAVAAARGEILVLVDGRARFNRDLLATSMRRFDDPRITAVRVGYRAGDSRILRMKDLAYVDERHGRSGLPFFALIRRREIMKDRSALDDPGGAWRRALERSRTELIMVDSVKVPTTATVGRGHLPGPTEIRAAGADEIVRGVRRVIGTRREKHRPDLLPLGRDIDDRVQIEYLGPPTERSLGGSANLAALRQLMPWARIDVGVEQPRALMISGGVLLDGRRCRLDAVRRLDAPTVDRFAFGIGLGDEGTDEEFEEWESFLRSSIAVSVRGPDSLQRLRDRGYGGPVQVIGDPALSLARPQGVVPVPGHVVISPTWVSGGDEGSDQRAMIDQFVGADDRLTAEGRHVTLMATEPGDDRAVIAIMDRLRDRDMDYLAGYDGLDAALGLIATADLMVGQTLPSIVLAAAMSIPFVAIETTPEIGDFVRSIGAGGAAVAANAPDRMSTVLNDVLDAATDMVANRDQRVADLKRAQSEIAERVRAEMTRR